MVDGRWSCQGSGFRVQQSYICNFNTLSIIAHHPFTILIERPHSTTFARMEPTSHSNAHMPASRSSPRLLRSRGGERGELGDGDASVQRVEGMLYESPASEPRVLLTALAVAPGFYEAGAGSGKKTEMRAGTGRPRDV